MEDWFLDLTHAVCDACGITEPPNSCNGNLYNSGMESVGWHADDEVLFDATNRDALIVSLSLGAPRQFELRPKSWESGENSSRVRLSNGDLCTMEGFCQRYYVHCVPKEPGCDEARINLTWRWLVCHDSTCPLSTTGPLGDKLRELASAKNRLKWMQRKKFDDVLREHVHISPEEVQEDGLTDRKLGEAMVDPQKQIKSDEKAELAEKARMAHKRLEEARDRLAELKRRRASMEGPSDP
jgi:hypothetical protein